MTNSIFGEFTFNTGWKTNFEIPFFGENINITIKAKAYFEKDGISDEQKISFGDFDTKKIEQLKKAEKLLCNFDIDASTRFTPRTLLFQRNGEYALLLDDNEDEDDGIVICLSPKMKIVSQDEYL